MLKIMEISIRSSLSTIFEGIISLQCQGGKGDESEGRTQNCQSSARQPSHNRSFHKIARLGSGVEPHLKVDSGNELSDGHERGNGKGVKDTETKDVEDTATESFCQRVFVRFVSLNPTVYLFSDPFLLQ